MAQSYSKATYIITYPDVSGGTEFFKEPGKYDVDIRKVGDVFKVDVELKEEKRG